jgi:hypothetical protein
LLCLLACAGAPAADSALRGGDSCTELVSGTWTFSGAAFGMGDETMDALLTFDADACAFTITEWSMAMDDLPNGGVIDGDAVQLDGLNYDWRTCSGVAQDAQSASGTCSNDGDPWAIAVSTLGG